MQINDKINKILMKYKLLIVGSFNASEKGIYGGVAKSCEMMMKSSFASRFIITTIDSTQISNPVPHFVIRSFFAIKRLLLFTGHLISARPNAVLLFASVGASVVEKGTMGWICRLFGIPSLIFPRGGEVIYHAERSMLTFMIIKMSFSGPNIFLCQGERWREFAINKLMYDDDHVALIPNWTATEEHLSIGRNRSFNNELPINLLFLAWLEEFKGIFELLRVIKNLTDKGYEIKLTIAGGGNAEEKANYFVKQNNLDKIIKFAGWVEGEELNTLLAKSDIFVLPSYNEGMPNAMIEAMAASLAVIVTSVGVIPDYIEDRKHAMLIPPRDEKSLEEALKLVVSDNDLRHELAKNGHNLVKENFSLKPAMKLLGDVVEETIVESL